MAIVRYKPATCDYIPSEDDSGLSTSCSRSESGGPAVESPRLAMSRGSSLQARPHGDSDAGQSQGWAGLNTAKPEFHAVGGERWSWATALGLNRP